MVEPRDDRPSTSTTACMLFGVLSLVAAGFSANASLGELDRQRVSLSFDESLVVVGEAASTWLLLGALLLCTSLVLDRL